MLHFLTGFVFGCAVGTFLGAFTSIWLIHIGAGRLRKMGELE